MTRYDGMAFETPDIRENEHDAMPCKPRSSSETTGNMVNDPVGTVDLTNLPTVHVSCPEDDSFAAFLVEPMPEDGE